MAEDARVITLVRAGEVEAFAEVVEHYQSPILRYLYRLTGDNEVARDLAQDTFIQAYKSILKTRAEISLKAWLYRIATNNALQHLRRKRLLTITRLSSSGHDFASKTDRNDYPGEPTAVQEALEKVPVEQRVCMVMHFVEGFKYREIAETIGISEEAVRKRVARGKKTFIEQYNRGGGRRV